MDTQPEGTGGNSENEDENKSTTFTDYLNVPIHFMRNIIPGSGKLNEEIADAEVVGVGDKLRKKRLKSKRKTNKLARRHSFDLDVRKKRLGHNRSMVRYIGSNVPLAPSKRAYFELINHSSKGFMSNASSFISKNYDQMRTQVGQVKERMVPSLADLGQLMWEEFNVFDDGINNISNEEDHIEDETIMFKAESKKPEKDVVISGQNSMDKPCTSKQEEKVEETTKISALEDELAKLRAQIAMIVSAQQAAPTVNAPSQPPQIAIVPPTPIRAPAPPPPPPPPPIPTIQIKPPLIKKSSIEAKTEKPSTNTMDDVLKGIATVKLKTVDISRSPGGTPLKKNQPREDSDNHADIIARALKEKFKNTKMNYDSPDKGSPNSSFSDSPPVFSQSKAQSRVERPVPKPRPRPRRIQQS